MRSVTRLTVGPFLKPSSAPWPLPTLTGLPRDVTPARSEAGCGGLDLLITSRAPAARRTRMLRSDLRPTATFHSSPALTAWAKGTLRPLHKSWLIVWVWRTSPFNFSGRYRFDSYRRRLRQLALNLYG